MAYSRDLHDEMRKSINSRRLSDSMWKNEFTDFLDEIDRRDDLVKRLVNAGENLIQLVNFNNKKADEYIDAWYALMKEV